MPPVVPAAELQVLQSTVVDQSALNFSDSTASFSQNINGRTYQRQPASTHRGWQYATYYDSKRHVCLARRRLPAGSWEVIRFTDHTISGDDSHNVTALGICALDGTIHLAFDHHGHALNYRVSQRGVALDPESVVWSTNLFGPVSDTLGSAGALSGVTYPTFFGAPGGNLMLYYRSGGSGSGDGMIHEYDGTTHDWTTGMGKFISRSGTYNGVLSTNSTSRNPYINGISYAGNRLHASWGWRESAGGSQFNHDLNYAYSDDDGRTWFNSAGTRIGTTGSAFITLNSPGVTVAPIPQDDGLSNQYTHYAYPDGSCHVMLAHNEAGTGTTRYHHHWRDASGTWSSAVLPFSGSRPKLAGDDDRSLFLAYSSGNVLRIAKGVPNAAMTAWSWSEIHAQSDTTEGGEGHIDYPRWETDRILSVYGQEKSGADGLPTALHVFDYQVSAKAILPVPADDQAAVSGPTTLEWTAGIGAVSHRVYLGTDRAGVANATTASPEHLGEQGATQFTPAAPLAEGTTYYWRVDEVDAAAVVHPGLVWSFTTAVTGPVYQLISLAQDASVREVPDVVDEDKATTLLGTGGSSPRVDRCTVYVFQLPDFGPVAAPFTHASFTFEFQDKQGVLRDNDLYGLDRRDTPEVLPADYHGKTATAAPRGSRLETGILTDATPFGMVVTSPSGEAALRDYLNTQYASGAGANEFVFLRLNTAGYEDSINRATLTMSEGATTTPTDTRPRVVVTIPPFSALQEWRALHFGNPFNTGSGADETDPDDDRESNFLEFVTGQDPNAGTTAATQVVLAGSTLEFTYPRSVAAVADGIRFAVEWSDTLRSDEWSPVGVTESVISDDGILQLVAASVPTQNAPMRFVRLRATGP